MPLFKVNPGDLVAATSWNTLVDLVNNLEGRVSDLESGGTRTAPRISQVLPSGAVTVGDQIRIYGSNFGYNAGSHSVFFGNTRATTFMDGSSDTLLIVQIPDPVEGATEGGTSLTMSVGNLYGFTTWALTIKSKPATASGGFQFSYQGSMPATPTQNAPILYNFELKSTYSENLTVTIAPTIQVVPPLPPGVADPGLPGLLTILDGVTPVANGQVALPEGATKTISARLALPDGTQDLKYSLSVRASAPNVQPVIEALPTIQQVGQAAEQWDPYLRSFEAPVFVTGDGNFASDTGGISGVAGTLRIRQGTTATIRVPTRFSGIPAGVTYHYQIAPTFDTPANGWVAVVNPATPNPLPASNGVPDTFFDITAPTTAATAILRLTLTRLEEVTNNRRSVAYRLILL